MAAAHGLALEAAVPADLSVMGGGAGSVINQSRAAAWELHLGDIRAPPPAGSLSTTWGTGAAIQEKRKPR